MKRVILFLILVFLNNQIFSEMIKIEGGEFQMGNSEGTNDVKPVHNVKINSFWFSEYELTQEEWEKTMKTNPSYMKDGDFPVTNISWFDAVRYCNQKSLEDGYTQCYRIEKNSDGNNTVVCDFNANGYRLPTEAEWEYAAKGGNQSKNFDYAGSSTASEIGWFDSNSDFEIKKIMQKKPNELGLYDLSGNVWEWCWDHYSADYYENSPDDNPKGPGEGEERVMRGGSAINGERIIKTYVRNYSIPDLKNDYLGFRVARTYSDSPAAAVQDSEVQDNQIEDKEIEELKKYAENTKTNGEKTNESGEIFVESGSMTIGDTFDKGGKDEKPVHQIFVNSFWMSQYEVTQKEWKMLMLDNPSHFENDSKPVENISWYDAVVYCNKKSMIEGLKPCYQIYKDKQDPDNKNRYDKIKWLVECDFSANGYRLPTEAEWEYAARGGKNNSDYLYSGSNNANECAWWKDNSDKQTKTVGQKKSNILNLFDLSGNVAEWCWDWYDLRYYSESDYNNPKGPSSGKNRVVRGGSWRSREDDLTVSGRLFFDPSKKLYNIGLRLVRNAD